MRKLFVIAALGLYFPTMVMAGYHVSTEVQHRHAVLEEFTGIHCVYCPQGHKIAASLLEFTILRFKICIVQKFVVSLHSI